MCVQNFDDSRGPAIRITYRISLRSSSLRFPRHPLSKVVMDCTANGFPARGPQRQFRFRFSVIWYWAAPNGAPQAERPGIPSDTLCLIYVKGGPRRVRRPEPPDPPGPIRGKVRFGWCDNDPSAGSPTETLLRLHLPLNDKVQTSSRSQVPMKEPDHNPESSPDHSIGRCDGRCVQRAGT